MNKTMSAIKNLFINFKANIFNYLTFIGLPFALSNILFGEKLIKIKPDMHFDFYIIIIFLFSFCISILQTTINSPRK